MNRWGALVCAGIGTALGCSPYPLDDVIRMNHVQARGTHNSYHIEPADLVDPSHAFTHAPLDIQLEEQGVRQFELDLHRHVNGTLEVFHIAGGLDWETTCLLFSDCLSVIKAWSDDHPEHTPVVVWLETKDEADYFDSRYMPFAGHVADIEEGILAVWPRERLIIPDDVRGENASLPEAIAVRGWPTLGETRGRVAFALLDKSESRAEYLADSPNLAGKLMFADAESDVVPSAAMFKIDDALGDGAEVTRLVQAGFMVTSNSDGVGDADEENAAQLAATLAAGSQFFSTNWATETDGYWGELPEGAPLRCNPVAAPAECTPADLEKPSR